MAEAAGLPWWERHWATVDLKGEGFLYVTVERQGNADSPWFWEVTVRVGGLVVEEVESGSAEDVSTAKARATETANGWLDKPEVRRG